MYQCDGAQLGTTIYTFYQHKILCFDGMGGNFNSPEVAPGAGPGCGCDVIITEITRVGSDLCFPWPALVMVACSAS